MDYKMIKSAGEHWVCATLARHGWAPALTRDGLERTDIVAVSTKLAERPVIEMQVKTASQRGEATKWVLGTKAQIVTVLVEDRQYRILHDGTQLAACPRAVIKEVTRRSASGHPSYEV